MEHPDWCTEDHPDTEPHTSEWDGVTTDDGHALVRLEQYDAQVMLAFAVHNATDGAEAIVRITPGRLTRALNAALLTAHHDATEATR
ncbi:hypothetical protein GCM10018962_77360 [Dactylosporangium matsuzakiense]|uniref:hypothetical protein n=1 Tax=Dactylosporangium matsuzakiense TaxID=53360 RepID=UPI0031EAA887